MSGSHEAATQELHGTTELISVGAAYRQIWSLRRFLPLWSCAYIVSIVISVFAAFLAYLLGRAIGLSFQRVLEELVSGKLDLAANIATLLPFLFSFVAVLPVMAWGVTRLQINVADGHGKFSDLWDLLGKGGKGSGFGAFMARSTEIGKFLVFQLVFFIIYDLGSAVALIGVMFNSHSITQFGWFIALFVWWPVRIRWSFTYLFMVDQGCRGVEALRQSWRITKGQWWRTAALVLLVPVAFSVGCEIVTILVLESIEASGRIVGEINDFRLDEGTSDPLFHGARILNSFAMLLAITVNQLAIGVAYRQMVPTVRSRCG